MIPILVAIGSMGGTGINFTSGDVVCGSVHS